MATDKGRNTTAKGREIATSGPIDPLDSRIREHVSAVTEFPF